MSAGCVSNVPVACTPVQQTPAATGGGPVDLNAISQGLASVQQGLAEVSQELAAIQGTSGGGATTYDPTPVEGGGPSCGCDGYVTPAPVDQQQTAPGDGSTTHGPTDPNAPVDPNATGTDLPPEPIPADPNSQAPNGTNVPVPTDPNAPLPTDPSTTGQPTTPGDGTTQPTVPTSNTPASQLADWPRWQQEFAAIGVDQANIDRIGAQNLSAPQLALVYMTIRRELQDAAGTTGKPGTTAPGTGAGTGGWSADWEKKFAALGLTADEMAKLKQKAQQPGVDDAALQALYDQLKAAAPQQGNPTQGTSPAAGWNDAWAKKFHDLGMPDSVVQAYAESGAPESGLTAAYNDAATRLDDFKKRGWFDKFTAEKMPADQMWQMLLADKPVDDKTLQAQLDALHGANMPGWEKKAQLAFSFFPGGELLQYALGHKVISGKEIDRSNPLNIGLAAVSGLAAFASIRGVMNITRGWKAASALAAGTSELQKTAITMKDLGFGGQSAALEQAASGALQTMGTKSKIASLIPFTTAHKSMTGLAAVESAAKTFNNGGASALMQAGEAGSLQVSTLGRTFEDILRGSLKVEGTGIAYLGNLSMPFKQLKSAPMAFNAATNTIVVNKALNAAHGGQALTALLEAGGTRIAHDPTIMAGNAKWLQALQTAFETGQISAEEAAAFTPESARLIDNMGAVGKQELTTMGQLMAGNAAGTLGATTASGMGGILGKVKPGVAEYFQHLAGDVAKLEQGAAQTVAGGGADSLSWYHQLIAQATTELTTPGGAAAASAAAHAVGGGGAVVAAAGTAATTAAHAGEQLMFDFGGATTGGAAADVASTATAAASTSGAASSAAAHAAAPAFDRLDLRMYTGTPRGNQWEVFVGGGTTEVGAARQVIADEIAQRGTTELKLYTMPDGRLRMRGPKAVVESVRRAIETSARGWFPVAPAVG